jgi:transcriptional regulator NrdR family protein
MKCPATKGRKICGAELQTRRTLANGTSVRRERLCPRCGKRMFTIERFESDIEAAKVREQQRISELEAEIRRLADEIESSEDVFRGLKAAIERAGSRSGGSRGQKA